MKKKHTLLASFLVSAQVLGVVIPVQAYESEKQTETSLEASAFKENYNESYLKYLNEGIYSDSLKGAVDMLFERSKGVKSNEELNALIDDFTNLPAQMDTSDAAHYHADGELLAGGDSYSIYNTIKKKVMEDSNVARVTRFANQLAIGYTKDGNGFYVLLNDLVKTNTIKGAQKELERVFSMVEQHKNSNALGEEFRLEIVAGKLTTPDLVVEEAPKEHQLSDEEIVTQPELPKNEELKIDVELSNVSDEAPAALPNDYVVGSNRSGTYYEYNAEKGERVRVEYTYEVVDGKEQRKETKTVEAKGLSSMWSDRFDKITASSGTTSRPDWSTGKSEEEKKSTLTLQYTLNKDDKFPVFVDTGIYTDEEGNAQYEDVYEVLYQIAVNAEDGFLVEDKDKLLVVVEGKPVYIIEREEVYSEKEIEKLFESFEGVELLVGETRIGTTESLEWQLRSGKEQQVLVDNEEITLETAPQIRGERVVLPIVEVANLIGGVVEEKENTITVRYGENVVTFEEGVADAKVNGKLVNLTVPVERDEQGVYTTNLMPIFEAIGVESIWDEQESVLFLNNTKRQEMLKIKEEAKKAKKEKDEEETNKSDKSSGTAEKADKKDNE